MGPAISQCSGSASFGGIAMGNLLDIVDQQTSAYLNSR